MSWLAREKKTTGEPYGRRTANEKKAAALELARRKAEEEPSEGAAYLSPTVVGLK